MLGSTSVASGGHSCLSHGEYQLEGRNTLREGQQVFLGAASQSVQTHSEDLIHSSCKLSLRVFRVMLVFNTPISLQLKERES